MKIKELKELLKKQKKEYVDIEVYKFNSIKKSIHTDYINSVENYTDEYEIEDYELMNEYDYNHSILANACEEANFSEWYDDNNAIVLVIILK